MNVKQGNSSWWSQRVGGIGMSDSEFKLPPYSKWEQLVQSHSRRMVQIFKFADWYRTPPLNSKRIFGKLCCNMVFFKESNSKRTSCRRIFLFDSQQKFSNQEYICCYWWLLKQFCLVLCQVSVENVSVDFVSKQSLLLTDGMMSWIQRCFFACHH